MTMMDPRRLELAATAAYEAYRIGVEGVAVNGDELPHWPGLKELIRVAWRMSADAAVMVANGPAEPLPSRWQPLGTGVRAAEVDMPEPAAGPAQVRAEMAVRAQE
jgi:hypothetical protein